ncbi:hypothetical protein [Myxosarcina sp. GI1]|uniref:hypothetical protein n=1 Tax=Myxosarcina sp. GI1 TaxID=1541065 RepID=UPI0012E04208|nr:hypothetical protein [Myxosarcina sp. GI1]
MPGWIVINSGVIRDNTRGALWSLMRSHSDYSKFLKAEDGVHFNRQGYEFLT